jgi:acyl dehydratase
MIEIANVSFLRQRIGQEIAVSDWLEVTQARIDQFAEATGDRQWIHVDVSRAASLVRPVEVTDERTGSGRACGLTDSNPQPGGK